MSAEEPTTLADEDIQTVWRGTGTTTAVADPRDADGTDGDATDSSDGDATDSTDGDATDSSDGDAGDADGTDA